MKKSLLLRHSELCEESISKSISNIKDSSVTSFPQNDDCSLRHCEVTKSLPILDVCENFSRHKEKNTQYPTWQSCDSHPELDSGSINFNLKIKPTLIDSDFRQNDPKQLRSRKGTGMRLLLRQVKIIQYKTKAVFIKPLNNIKDLVIAVYKEFAQCGKRNFVPAFTLAEVFSPHPTCARKTAFTLAEVLITLGIIGIVAAMTIPLLISAHKKRTVETQLKKSYTVLNQMLKHSEIDNGSAIYWEWEVASQNLNNTNAFFDKYFLSYLAINDSKPSIGINSYYKIYTYQASDISWFFSNVSNPDWRMLNDGSALMFTFGNISGGVFHVVLPSSSKKSRLIIGRDVFRFVVIPTEANDAFLILPGGMHNRDWTCNYLDNNRNDFINGCVGNYRPDLNTANFCTMLVYCNNWKIPDDYPVKF